MGLDLLDLNNDQLWVLGQVTHIDRDPVSLAIGVAATWIPGSLLLWPMSWTLGWSFYYNVSLSLNLVSLFHYPCIPLSQKMCESGEQCVFLSLYCLNTNTTFISLTIHLYFIFFILQMETLLTTSENYFIVFFKDFIY